ncbi:RbsD/FucU domain-containing protein [Agromyces sp. G08B096]|uniref:RbsD/FucU domain-containing protein n=1 Tax=Agromyces sp. G08B096 TaxID=3156399 RepID=A0AAU7W521_9MICO
MLSGIHPILTGDLLAELDRLGHGDELVVADANFPSHRVAASASPVAVVDLPGLSSPSVVEAVRTVLPLDTYEVHSVLFMAAEDGDRPPVQQELLTAAEAPEDRVTALERFAFYERAARARLVIRTGEFRPYGNLLLRKGVVAPYSRGEAAG